MTLPIKLDFRSGIPIYTQITDQIRNLVVSGELKVGDQLPTVRQLATDLRINFNTVARAYRMLDEAKLISTQQGRGTYIWDEPSNETLAQLRSGSLQALAEHFVVQAKKLGYGPEEIENQVLNLLQAWREDLSQRDMEANK